MQVDTTTESLDITSIMRLLPHRFPFLLVDRVDSIVRPEGTSRVGTKIRAVKNVTYNEPFFEGHFPHRPVMPGVLQLEAMAQAAALSCVAINGPRMDVAIVGIDKAKFRRPVGPGDVLEILVEIVRDRGQMVVANAEARVRGVVVCECELLAKMWPMIETGKT